MQERVSGLGELSSCRASLVDTNYTHFVLRHAGMHVYAASLFEELEAATVSHQSPNIHMRVQQVALSQHSTSETPSPSLQAPEPYFCFLNPKNEPCLRKRPARLLLH